ncbi:MAG: hypothetical protein GF364_20180 [Candidatus Lokiarchaeota archaeon]|nr:hypothetical protein [Candidatus Lokiarchaeota archaeon]
MIDIHPKDIIKVSGYEDFVRQKMRELVEKSRINIQNYLVNTPDGVQAYKGCWVRDFTMLCESNISIIDAEFIKQGLDLFFTNQGSNGEIPDWVPYTKHKPVVYHLFNKHHFLDNPFWLVRLMVLYLQKSNNVNYFIKHEDDLLQGLKSENLWNNLDLLLQIDERNLRDDWGFTDCIKKTGVVLFSNLLKIDALRSFSIIYGYMDEKDKYEFYREQCSELVAKLDVLWDPHESLYYSATEVGRKIDIWGNAFAVYINALPEPRERKIANSIFLNRDKFVWNGQIRHLYRGVFWDEFLPGAENLAKHLNTYQNGAYWGTPAGWVAYAFEKAKAGAGRDLLIDLLSFYKENGIYECTYPEPMSKIRKMFSRNIYKKCPHYVASLALPARVMKL